MNLDGTRPKLHLSAFLAVLLAFLPVGGIATAGCGWSLSPLALPIVDPSADVPQSPIAAALRFLRDAQLRVDQPCVAGIDFAGDWPQWMSFFDRPPYVRDVSPFMVAFIHHALSFVAMQNRDALGLSDDDIATAAALRQAAIAFILRFQAPADKPDAGTFGFWPDRRQFLWPDQALLAALNDGVMPGPRFNGYLAPINLPSFAPHSMIPTDSDTTAAAYAALIDAARLDGAPPVTTDFARFFEDWRDRGQVPIRRRPAWLDADSRAYLTWLPYRDDPGRPNPNDVDPVVNADVLFALGRAGKLDSPGVTDAVSIVKAAVAAGLHPVDPFDLSLYYPDSFALHYSVARAYREAGVADLAPAVSYLVSDLVDSVLHDDSGRSFWDRGAPDHDTALAALALLNAGGHYELVDGAIDYLVSRQVCGTGAWQPGVFFVGRSDDGTRVTWVSQALTTALALEALCLRRLAP